MEPEVIQLYLFPVFFFTEQEWLEKLIYFCWKGNYLFKIAIGSIVKLFHHLYYIGPILNYLIKRTNQS